jgi:hypothetical protein
VAGDDFEELHELVAPGRSVWERMVHLRKAWSQVRALSPRERRDLALELGLEKGNDLLERLVEQHPEHAPPKHVLRALHELDPGATVDLVRALPTQTSEERLRALEAAANAAAEHLLDPAIEQRRFVIASPPAPILPAVAPAPLPPPREPSPAAVIACPVETPSPRVSDGSPQVLASAAEPARAAPAHVSDETIAALGKLPLVRRLRALRYDVDGVLDADDAGRVLRAFPDGWARRRATLVLLDEGVPLDASVLSELSSRADRVWCEKAARRARRRT